ncbi:MAG: hypothetical protein WD579_00495 [Candidatus Paceibacterota bacterium]
MEKKGNALAWLALIVGILALILAWSAYNRAGADLETQVDEQIEETVDETDNSAAAANADVEADTDTTDEETTDDTENDASAEVETGAVVE